MAAVEIEAAFLANHAEVRDGVLFVSSGFPEWWTVPALPTVSLMGIVIAVVLPREEVGVPVDITMRAEAPDGDRLTVLEIKEARRELQSHDAPEAGRYRFVFAINAPLTFTREGDWNFRITIKGAGQTFDRLIPLFVRVEPPKQQ